MSGVGGRKGSVGEIAELAGAALRCGLARGQAVVCVRRRAQRRKLNPSCPGGGGEGGLGGGCGPRPWRASTRAMASVVRATSVIFIEPEQCGHTEMSTANTRRSSQAQGLRPGGGAGSSPHYS
jgi:hypothetical protein